MKIYVVSLKSSTQRRKSIIKQFQRYNINFEFFDAINGKELSEEEITKYCDLKILSENPKWLNRGCIGCILSHALIYQRVIDENLKGAIILEDDMLINSEFKLLTEEFKRLQLHFKNFDEDKRMLVNQILSIVNI